MYLYQTTGIHRNIHDDALSTISLSLSLSLSLCLCVCVCVCLLGVMYFSLRIEGWGLHNAGPVRILWRAEIVLMLSIILRARPDRQCSYR